MTETLDQSPTASRAPGPPIAPVPTLPTAAIRRLNPCARDFRIVARQFPETIPLLPETVDLLVSQGVDVLWAGVQLLTDDERGACILWTLRYRQPHVAARVRRAGLTAEADAFAALPFETRADVEAAWPLLEHVRDTAWVARDTAWTTTWTTAWAAARATAWDSTRAAAWDELQRAGGRWVLATLAAREAVTR